MRNAFLRTAELSTNPVMTDSPQARPSFTQTATDESGKQKAGHLPGLLYALNAKVLNVKRFEVVLVEV